MFFFTPEAFFGSFKRDYVYQACLETLEEVGRQLPAWIDHYNREAPHSALEMQSPAEFYAAWLVKNKTQPVKIKRGSTAWKLLDPWGAPATCRIHRLNVGWGMPNSRAT